MKPYYPGDLVEVKTEYNGIQPARVTDNEDFDEIGVVFLNFFTTPKGFSPTSGRYELERICFAQP